MRTQCRGRGRPKTWLLLGIAAVAGGTIPTGSALAQRVVAIQFDPPDGTTFVERARIQKTVEIKGRAPETQTGVAETRYSIRRVTGGYVVRTTPIRPPDVRAEEGMAALLQSILSSLEIEWDLDQQGKLVRARGIETGARQLAFAKPMLDALNAALGQQGATMTQVAERQWNERALFALMAGRQVTLDEPRTGTATLPLPHAGPVTFQLTGLFTAPVACAAGDCLRANFRYGSRDPAIGRGLAAVMRLAMINMIGALAPGSAVADKIPEFQIVDSTGDMEDTRVVDPRTGLPHGHAFRRVMGGRFAIKGDPEVAEMRLTETQEYTFTYEPQR